jgi:hypothetical protein
LLSRAALIAFISCFILRSLTKWRPFSFQHSFSPINCIIILRKPSARQLGSPGEEAQNGWQQEGTRTQTIHDFNFIRIIINHTQWGQIYLLRVLGCTIMLLCAPGAR